MSTPRSARSTARAALRVLQAIVLTLAVGAIVLGYRFALFLITLYGT